MANKTGNTAPSLKKSVFENSDKFSFFQIMRILRRMSENGDEEERLRVKPLLSLDHPGSEVAGIEESEDKIDLLTTFLGLYGISSPLPTFYTEDLVSAQQSGNNSAKILLDVIHQRLYSLFFKSLEKYRPLYSTVGRDDEKYFNILFSILGGRNKAFLKKIKSPHKMIRYAGLLNQQPRSALGLKTLLKNEFKDIDIEVEQCVKRKVKISRDQASGVGEKSNSLGVDTVIGEEIEDRNGKIKIIFGPLKRHQFHGIINNPERWSNLIFMIQFYMTMPFECDLEFVLMKNEANKAKLSSSRLGKDSWVFSGESGEEAKTVFHLNLPNNSI